MIAVVAFILLVFLYSLLSRRLEGTILTIPLVFAGAGIVLILVAPGLVRREMTSQVWLILAEITYVIVLFNGATRINLGVLRGEMRLPGRLLVIGLPLTIVFGMSAAALVLSDLSCGGGRPGLHSGLHRHRPGRGYRQQSARARLHSRGAQRRVGA